MSYQGGETYDELRLRAEKAWEWLLNFSKKKGYTKIVVISHGRIITFLFAIILGFIPNGFNLQIENTSYFVFKVNEKWRPQLIASNLLNSH